MGLRDKGADPYMQSSATPNGSPADGQGLPTELDNGIDVLHGLAWVPNHKIQLNGMPTVLINGLHRA